MDDRKKQINELEQRIREQNASLDALLTRLGETLLERVSGSAQADDSAFEELAVYRKLQKDIADSEVSIQAVEDRIRRFRELEEGIEDKEQKENAFSKELAALYGRLGRLLFDVRAVVNASPIDGASSVDGVPSADGGNFADFCAPYRDQADALLTKVLSLEERLAGLEESEGGNVFTWIGKGAQGLVLRSFLTKAQDSLEQLRRTVGERYSRRDNSGDGSFPETAEITDLCTTIKEKQAESHTLLQSLADLREERREISGNFSAEGEPLKQIQTMKNHITHVRDDLKALYRRMGAEAASIDGVERRQILDTVIAPEDRETLDGAGKISQAIADNKTAIQKLQASLTIDEEKDKIEKYHRMILEKKEKIVQAEKNIAEFEENIRASGAKIEKLQSIL